MELQRSLSLVLAFTSPGDEMASRSSTISRMRLVFTNFDGRAVVMCREDLAHCAQHTLGGSPSGDPRPGLLDSSALVMAFSSKVRRSPERVANLLQVFPQLLQATLASQPLDERGIEWP